MTEQTGEAGIDSDSLRAVLDGPWANVRHAVRRQLTEAQLGKPQEWSTETYRDWTYRQMLQLGDTPEVTLAFPQAYGGGDDPGGSVVAIESLAHGDLSLMVKAGVQWGLFGGAVQALGTAEHHQRYLPSIMSAELPGCFAMTETGHGSDVQSLATTATYDPAEQEFVINTPYEGARKDYIGNAARDGRVAVVFAQLITAAGGHGVHALMVPIRDTDGRIHQGVTITDCGHKAGLNGVDNGRLSFHQVRVPREALLDQYGHVSATGEYSSPIEGTSKRFFTMLGTLVRGRISVAGSAGAATKTALTIAVRYGQARRQFQRPGQQREVVVLDYLAHQRALLPRLAKSYAMHFAQQELVTSMDRLLRGAYEEMGVTGQHGGQSALEHAQRELESRAAGLKALTTWHATDTIQACREACGGAGYLSENRLPQLKADTDVFTTFEGDNTVLLQLVAKGLLTNYRDEFQNLGTFGVARFMADQVADTVIERTAARSLIDRLVAAAPGREDADELFDRGWQLKAFEDREKHVLDGVARRLRRAGNEETDAFTVFNDAQDHVLRAARVHIERIVLEAFVAGIDRCADPAVERLLSQVCDLFVLSTVEQDRAWFLEHNRFSDHRAKAVTQAVNQLCQQLRPHASTLVEAFAVPESCIAAPIAQGAEQARQDAAQP